ncbi:MAG: chromate efflux transporter [Anaerolineae bacterium]|nr:chromate efflux transporter [Anaerolineae bacterium]
MDMPPTPSLWEIARIFIRMGFTAFGGPAAHIAMFHDEFVTRRRWLTDQHFLDMLGATNLIPGPNSTEMAMHIGHARAGLRGLIVAGLSFIIPAALVVLLFAWLYTTYGTLPAAEGVLYGIKPVIIAVVLQAIFNLGRKAIKSWGYVVLIAAVFVLYLMGINELLLLFGGTLVALAVVNARRWFASTSMLAPLMFFAQSAAAEGEHARTLSELFLTFLKIGSVVYGSGYVLLAFLQSDFVERLHWLTEQQLIDAVAIGQFTPGPLFTTSTFVGYLVGGLPGAALATLGIFLPGFILVALVSPWVPRIRQNAVLSVLLDGVNAAALGLMAGVTVELARAALIDGVTVVLAIATAVLLLRYKIRTTWLIVGGGILGGVIHGLMATG